MLLNKNDTSLVRMENLIKNLELDNRTITINNGNEENFSAKREQIIEILSMPVNYNVIDEKLNNLKDKSINWLRKALQTDPTKKKYYDIPHNLLNLTYEK